LLEGVEVLILNALQREPHISHLTLEEAIEVSNRISPKKTFLTHISHRFGKHLDIEKMLPEGIFVSHDQLVIEI
jgi:phosphoribosyl 1,2-cyclic phosphate phosphodiesterase